LTSELRGISVGYLVTGKKLANQNQVELAAQGVVPVTLAKKQEQQGKIVIPRFTDETPRMLENADICTMMMATDAIKP